MHAATQPFAVLLAIPANWDEYCAATQQQPPSDYVRHLLGGGSSQEAWDDRYGHIADAAALLVLRLRELGVPVVCQAALSDFAAAAQQASTIVLFAHWVQLPGTHPQTGRPNGALEFCDGLADPAALDAALPAGFEGTLDLCCCHSVVPAAHLKLCRGDALRVVHGTEALDPLPALIIVRQLIEFSLQSGTDYRLARLQVAASLSRLN